MTSFDLKKSLDELHHRTKTGGVEWTCGDKTVKARLGDLRIVIDPQGTVRLRKMVDIDYAPHEGIRSKFSFQHETARKIYVTAQCRDAPESAELFKDKMLND